MIYHSNKCTISPCIGRSKLRKLSSLKGPILHIRLADFIQTYIYLVILLNHLQIVINFIISKMKSRLPLLFQEEHNLKSNNTFAKRKQGGTFELYLSNNK
jgi:hypothetical protein